MRQLVFIALVLSLTILIEVFAQTSQDYELFLKKGWNLVSAPVVSSLYKPFNLYPSNCIYNSSIFIYTSSIQKYERANKMPNATGFWIRVVDDCKIVVKEGKVLTSNDPLPTIKLKAGWNIIGSFADDIDFNAIKGNCNILKGPYWYDTYSRKWYRTSYLEDGMGYVVNAADDCMLEKGAAGGYYVSVVSDYLFKINDVFAINQSGFASLKSALNQNAVPITSGNVFVIKDKNSNPVASIDMDNGIMHIKGGLFESQQALNPSTDSPFILKDVNSTTISYIDESGNFYLKETLTQNLG